MVTQKIKLRLQRVGIYLLAAIAFLLPLKIQLSTILIIACFIFALFTADYKIFFSQLKSNKAFIFFIVFFLLHVAGLIYSDDLHYAFLDLQTKLSFIVFPFVITALAPSLFQIKFIKRAFVAGCVAALIVCIAIATVNYNNTHISDVFFYSRFSYIMHPTYFSFYISLALILIIDEGFSNSVPVSNLTKVLFFFCELFLFAGIALLSARMSIIATWLTVIIFIIIKWRKDKSKRKFSVALFCSLIAAFLIQSLLMTCYNRFSQVETSIEQSRKITTGIEHNTLKQEEYNSTTSRLALWKYAAEVITASPRNFLIGVGTGDIKNELMKVYKKYSFKRGIDENYNPHNQFLHTTVSLGITGLIVLILILFYPFVKSIKHNNPLLSIFLSIIILNCLTESILEVQSGIIFFCLFYCLPVTEMKLTGSTK